MDDNCMQTIKIYLTLYRWQAQGFKVIGTYYRLVCTRVLNYFLIFSLEGNRMRRTCKIPVLNSISWYIYKVHRPASIGRFGTRWARDLRVKNWGSTYGTCTCVRRASAGSKEVKACEWMERTICMTRIAGKYSSILVLIFTFSKNKKYIYI